MIPPWTTIPFARLVLCQERTWRQVPVGAACRFDVWLPRRMLCRSVPTARLGARLNG